MNYTEINVAGIILREPVTALTDFILLLMCFIFVNKINKIETVSNLKNCWKNFFFVFALSVCLGGFNHLFRYYLEGTPYQILWMIMNLMSHLIAYYGMLTGLRMVSSNVELNKKYETLFFLLIFVFSGLSLYFWDYKVVKVNSGLGLGFMFICYLIAHFKFNKVGASTVALGLFISFSTLIVHGFKLSFCDWFNFNDISHVIMMLSLFVIFSGVKIVLNNSDKVDNLTLNKI